jgi:hypothetical protein
MTTPTGDNAFLHELELSVRTELTLAETSPPEAEADGVPTVEWLLDPDAQRYEVGLRTLLGAVEAIEEGSRPGGRPLQAGMPESGITAGHLPDEPGPGTETEG